MSRLPLNFLMSMLVFLSVAGCGGPAEEKPAPKPAASGEAGPGEPAYGGRIVKAMLGDATNLIPPLATDSGSHEIASLLYVSPLKYDKDIRLVPFAAQSYEVLEDGKLLRFHLRPDLRWADGEELTASDVEFTYKLMIDPGTPTAYGEDFKAISAFTVLDKLTFEVRYDRPFARALSTWTSEILPRHALAGQDLTNTALSRAPLGAGPYRLKSWEAGRQIALAVSPDYFEGRAYLDEALYRIIPDLSTMFLELKAGNLDEMGLTPQQYLRQTQGPDWDANFHKFKYLAFSYVYMGYNLRQPPFSDPRVRAALAHAIDKREIIDGVLLGLGLPTVGPYIPGTWMYNTAIKDYEYDPALAEKLLAEAGWVKEQGVLTKDGKPFSFTILTNQGNDQRVKTATIIQQRLKNIGIEVKIRTVEWASFLKEFVDKGRFDAVILGWSVPQDPDIYDVWHSSKAVPGGLNFVDYKSPELDDLLEKGRRTLDQNERKAIYDRLQEVLHRDQPYCFLFTPYALPIVSSRIHGVFEAPAGIEHNFIRWWAAAVPSRPAHVN
ncbi:MAG: peptide-binding protein [Desulfovibrionaceae bacterium]|nr:peptide-binding protein [Desulfovibrionaceae bacterium]MBF0513215.1 peptide-binding protein [Desulfovibrionaceae bacterium]